MTEVTFTPGGSGRDSTATIVLDGAHDIFRFAVNMLSHQVEFMRAGRAILVELREHLTPERFDPMAKSLLGEPRYERLREYFVRDAFCVVCEEEIKPGHRYQRAAGAQALCEPCARDHAADTVALAEMPFAEVSS